MIHALERLVLVLPTLVVSTLAVPTLVVPTLAVPILWQRLFKFKV